MSVAAAAACRRRWQAASRCLQHLSSDALPFPHANLFSCAACSSSSSSSSSSSPTAAATAAAGPRADAAAVLVAAVPTQLIRLDLGATPGSSGPSQPLWLEVTRARGGRVEALCCGELLALSAGPDGRLEAAPAGASPRLGEPWVKAVPGLADSLKRVRQQQAADGSLPSALLAARGAAALTPLQTLADFRAAVAAAPGPWCDGTAPGEAPLGQQEQALLTAGELAAFLAGRRGVCLLQLHKGWGDTGAALQPLLRPWVLALLREAAGTKAASVLASAAPGGLGASVVLAARQQPWLAWGRHLAAQGVQSSIVADSPFYKLLIGARPARACVVGGCRYGQRAAAGGGARALAAGARAPVLPPARAWQVRPAARHQVACGCNTPQRSVWWFRLPVYSSFIWWFSCLQGASSGTSLRTSTTTSRRAAVGRDGWAGIGGACLPCPSARRPLSRCCCIRAASSRRPAPSLQSTGGRVTAEVAAAVEQELSALSAAPPVLPWSGGGGRKR